MLNLKAHDLMKSAHRNDATDVGAQIDTITNFCNGFTLIFVALHFSSEDSTGLI